jgi:hypothetical protein
VITEQDSKGRGVLKILRDSIWQFVGAVVGIVAVLVAYNIFFLQREVKSLQIVILASSSMVAVEPTVAQDIKILYRDQPAQNLSLIQVKVENNGNQPIRGEDYEQPIRLAFPSQSKIVEGTPLESNPPNIGLTVKTEGNIATLSPILLNEGDRIILRFIVIDMPSSVSEKPFQIAGGRIVGVKDIPIVRAITEKQVQESSPTSPLEFLTSFIVLGVLALMMVRSLEQLLLLLIKRVIRVRPMDKEDW